MKERLEKWQSVVDELRKKLKVGETKEEEARRMAVSRRVRGEVLLLLGLSLVR